MLRGPGAHPPRLGRPRGHVPPEGRLPREPRAAWRLVHRRPGRRPGELRSHHVGRAGGNEKRLLPSSADLLPDDGLARKSDQTKISVWGRKACSERSEPLKITLFEAARETVCFPAGF